MPSLRHTLASLVEKKLPLDKPHKLVGGDRGFKSIVQHMTQVTQENQEQIDEDLNINNVVINQVQSDDVIIDKSQINVDEVITQEQLIQDILKVETPKERKQRLKKEKAEVVKKS